MTGVTNLSNSNEAYSGTSSKPKKNEKGFGNEGKSSNYDDYKGSIFDKIKNKEKKEKIDEQI